MMIRLMKTLREHALAIMAGFIAAAIVFGALALSPLAPREFAPLVALGAYPIAFLLFAVACHSAYADKTKTEG